MMEYWDDEYYFDEPSKVEKIISNTVDQVKELLNDEIKRIIEDASEAEQKLKELNEEIYLAEAKLDTITKLHERTLEKAEQAEKYDIPRRYINKFVRDATGFFAPGDKVWVKKLKYVNEDCQCCKGKKKVTAIINGDEQEITCPKCDGRGYISGSKPEIIEEKVNEVHLKLCFREDRVNYWNTDCVYIGNSDYSTNVKNIFASKEEAEKELSKC